MLGTLSSPIEFFKIIYNITSLTTNPTLLRLENKKPHIFFFSDQFDFKSHRAYKQLINDR